MSTVTTRGERIQGVAATAAATNTTDFPIYLQSLRGTNLASGTSLVPTDPGEFFHVTGTSTTSFYDTANLLSGKEIVLFFEGSLTLNHNAASPPVGKVPFVLLSGANASVVAGQSITLRYDVSPPRMLQIGGTVGAGSGVASVSGGTGISSTGGTNPIISNLGVLLVSSSGPGISVTGTTANPVITNTGVLSVTHGTGISITGPASNPVITNTGVVGFGGGPGIGVGGTASIPIASVLVIGQLQLGGAIPSMGSSRLWFYGGNYSNPIPLEFPIETFIDVGATTCSLQGFIFDFVGPDATVSLTVNGAILAGSTYGIGVSSIGGTVSIAGIPLPGGANRRMGLSILPSGSSGVIHAVGVTFN